MEWKHPSIIALKGYPFTGKSSLAFDLALHLRLCQLLCLDDILDSITPDGYSSVPASDQLLVARAFDILCGLVEKQLRIGQSVIIDSLPLSRIHLDRLALLCKSSNATKFIIIECQIEKQYAWKMRFEEKHPKKDGEAGAIAWYKAWDWEADVAKIVNGYDKQRLDEPIPGVSRLLLNVDEPQRGRHVIQAIQTLVFCQGDRHVDYRKWGAYNLSIMHRYEYKGHDQLAKCHDNCGHDHDHDHHPRRKKELINQRLVSHSSRSCKDGHRITLFKEEGLDGYEADCGVCETPLIGPAYACNSCQMALHVSCAEMEAGQNKSFTPRDFPAFIENSTSADNKDPYVYSFEKKFPCFHCREAGQEFSDGCSSCIYESHLKSRLIPTVIEHEGHEHKLSFWAMEISSKGAYTCGACGKEGAYAAYACYGCEKNYHVKCALLPYPLRDHNHGGHQHTVELLFEREDKDQDDFPCDHCLENMSPEDWYYYCALCNQIYHLDCAFLEDPDQ